MWWANPAFGYGSTERRRRLWMLLGCAVLDLSGLAVFGLAAHAAAGSPPQAPLYGAPGQPNFSGIWRADMHGPPPGLERIPVATPTGKRDASGRRPPIWGTTPPPLTPEYAARYRKITDAANAGNPLADTVSQCQAIGTAFLETGPGDMEVIQTPGQITMIQESGHEVRRIHTDGRKPDPNPDPSYDGYNIGHFQGKTLVAEVTGLRPETPMDTTDTPHSDALQITERWTLVTPNVMRVDAVATDAKAFTHPWSATHWWSRAPAGEELVDEVCEDNNRNPTNADGSQGFSAPH